MNIANLIVEKKSPLPRYLQVEQNLIDIFKSGRFSIGDALPAERELVRMTGVSRITVRKAIDNLEDQGLVRKEWGRGIFIVKIPEVLRSHRIGFLSIKSKSYMDHPVTAEIFRGILNYLAMHSYRLEFIFVDPKELESGKLPEYLKGLPLDGLIVKEHFIPIDYVKQIIDPSRLLYLNEVSVVDTGAAYAIAAGHLLELGHRRIGVITGDKNMFYIKDIHASLSELFRSKGVEFDESLLRYGPYTTAHGHDGTMDLIPKARDVTALLAGDEHVALGCLQALRKLNLKCPEDVSIVCLNNFICSSFDPPMTTVDLNRSEIGGAVARGIIDIIENGIRSSSAIHQTGNLIVRQSAIPLSK